MIEYAKKQYPKIHFEQQYMQDLNIKLKFDAVICLGSIIAFNETNEEVFQTFKNFNNTLKKNGLLLIETFNPINYIQNKSFRKRFTDTSIERTIFEIKAKYFEHINPRKQTLVSKRVFYSLKTNQKLSEYSKESRMYFPQEISFFLHQSGFEVLEMYGGNIDEIDLKSTNLNKYRILIVAKKK